MSLKIDWGRIDMPSREWLKRCSEQMMKLGSAQCIVSKAQWAAFQTGEQCRKKTIISVNCEEATLIEMVFQSYIDDCHRILEERYKENAQ